MLYDYLFETEGGAVLVETTSYEEAVEVILEHFEEFDYIDRLEPWEGEMSGYDTYYPSYNTIGE